MSANVFLWWVLLCVVSVLNIAAWSVSFAALSRRQSVLPAWVYERRRLQLLLSAGYVFGCAFRSALPVYDVGRVCLFDTWLSSVIVGRSVATFAELCFALQWALMLGEISRATGSGVGRVTAKVVVPLIAIAETFSWYSVLTTSNLGHVAEESIWGLCAVMQPQAAFVHVGALIGTLMVANVWMIIIPNQRALVEVLGGDVDDIDGALLGDQTHAAILGS